MLLFHLVHGKTRPQKAHTKFYLTFLKVLPKKNFSLFFFKAKNEAKLEKIFCLLLLGQKPFFAIFEKKKKIFSTSNFEFYFWQMVFDVRGRFMPT